LSFSRIRVIILLGNNHVRKGEASGGDKHIEPVGEMDARLFYKSYFSRNNIELDVIRVCFFSNIRGRGASADWIGRKSGFKYVSRGILRKCVDNQFLARRARDEYVVTFKGAEALLCVIGEIVKRLAEGWKAAEAIAEEMHRDGICFAGLGNDIASHYRFVELTLSDLLGAGIVNRREKYFALSPIDEREKKAGESVVKLLPQLMPRRWDILDRLLSDFKYAFDLDNLSVRFLIQLARREGRLSLAQFLERVGRGDPSIEELIDDGRRDAFRQDDKLKEAALACLRAHFSDNERTRDKLYSEVWIGLAVFCKQNGVMSRARDFYQMAYEVLKKYPEHSSSAKRQLANSLGCDRRIKMEKGDFQGAMQSCSEEEAIWHSLGMAREKTFCECMKLEIQAHAAEQMGNYLEASELWKHCSKLSSTLSKKRATAYLAKSLELEGKHFEKLGDHLESSRRFEKAANYYAESNDARRANIALGSAHQSKAMGYKDDPRHSFGEVASEFLLAKEKYDLAEYPEPAKVCESDYYKYKGLDARGNGNYDDAIKDFQQGRLLQYRIAESFTIRASKYLVGAKWFEGIILETEVERDAPTLIPNRDSLDDCMRKLRQAGDIFSEIGDENHAQIDYCLSIILMAVDHFHARRIGEANQALAAAKHELPDEFSAVLLQDQISDSWQPLRYTLKMIEEFNKYSRKIETEKGFSFESRVREVLRREYSNYSDIESRAFTPDDDEVGIVFPDKTPIEIDALGIRQDHGKIRLLIGEIKNQNKPIDLDEINLLRRKTEFMKCRYSKIAKLQSLSGVEVEHLVFISRSGFTSRLYDEARPVDVLLLKKGEINEMMKRHRMHALP